MTLYECMVITFEMQRGRMIPVKRSIEVIDDSEKLGTYCPPGTMVSVIPLRKAPANQQVAPPRESGG
jgi:hypothetical protein